MLCYGAIRVHQWKPDMFLCSRYLSGGSPGHLYGLGPSPFVSPVSPAFFVPTPPPNLSRLISRQQGSRERRASPSSLPGRLNRALFLGTIPSLARTGETPPLPA